MREEVNAFLVQHSFKINGPGAHLFRFLYAELIKNNKKGTRKPQYTKIFTTPKKPTAWVWLQFSSRLIPWVYSYVLIIEGWETSYLVFCQLFWAWCDTVKEHHTRRVNSENCDFITCCEIFSSGDKSWLVLPGISFSF